MIWVIYVLHQSIWYWKRVLMLNYGNTLSLCPFLWIKVKTDKIHSSKPFTIDYLVGCSLIQCISLLWLVGYLIYGYPLLFFPPRKKYLLIDYVLVQTLIYFTKLFGKNFDPCCYHESIQFVCFWFIVTFVFFVVEMILLYDSVDCWIVLLSLCSKH